MKAGESPGGDPFPHFRTFGYFWRAYRAMAENLERSLAGGPLSIVEYQVLFRLTHAEGGRMRFIRLGTALFLSNSRVSQMMNSLVDRGFVSKEVTASDRRATFAVITEAGRAVFEQTNPVFFEALGRFFGKHLSDDDATALSTMMMRFLEDEDTDQQSD